MAIYKGTTKLTGTGVQVDNALSTTSPNPVQNKAFAVPLIYTVKQTQKSVIREMNEQEVVDASELVSSTSMINPVALDLSSNTQLKKLTCSGTSTTPLTGLSSVTVSNAAPLDSSTSPQIDVNYSSLDRTGLVSMFNSMPYNVGYTVVGSPTITDGVATDLLNRTNYFQLPAFPAVVNAFEMVLKVKGSGQNRSILFNSYTGPSGFYKAKTQISRTEAAVSKWVFKPCSNSTEEAEYRVSANGGIPYTPNEWVYVKHSMVSNGDDTYTYTLSYSLDGTTYTDVASKTSSYRISGTDWGGMYICSDTNFSANDSITIHSLDLNESYIKVNNAPWFTGKAAMTKTCSVVGCTGTADLTQDDKNIALNKFWELTVA